jgi:Rieske 2Fe-2S family protein
LRPCYDPKGSGARASRRRWDYLVKANWKLVWENNRECYHCNVNHPQYIKANFDHYNSDDSTPAIRDRMSSAAAAVEQRWETNGVSAHKQTA